MRTPFTSRNGMGLLTLSGVILAGFNGTIDKLGSGVRVSRRVKQSVEFGGVEVSSHLRVGGEHLAQMLALGDRLARCRFEDLVPCGLASASSEGCGHSLRINQAASSFEIL